MLRTIAKINQKVWLNTYRRFVFRWVHFSLDGSFNTQNVRICGTKRPAEANQIFSYSPSIMILLLVKNRVNSCDSYTRSIHCSERVPLRSSTGVWIVLPFWSSSTSPRLVFRLAGNCLDCKSVKLLLCKTTNLPVVACFFSPRKQKLFPWRYVWTCPVPPLL